MKYKSRKPRSAHPKFLKPAGRRKVIMGSGRHLVYISDTLFDEDLYGPDSTESTFTDPVPNLDTHTPPRAIW